MTSPPRDCLEESTERIRTVAKQFTITYERVWFEGVSEGDS